ncbi:MAG: helix-turn-helix transcriptional regulator [Smithella sp.]|nr:helix-turn-helix transcriptional regulator [Smithella sp.]MDM7988748.1 XRE family transcriptional regulator [Smithella sp.]HQG65041.1 XRE family transcriptional regulator [Smithella sp.]HQH16070.1 XRE family transcriptional regulator [Smithella sp.]HQI73585.1 XRE family transcriptional regulator [Smithella sp.]
MIKGKKTKQSFGQNIRNYRESKGLSVRELAHETGYPADLLEKVEKDEMTPPVALVLQLGRSLKVDVEKLDPSESKKASSRVKSLKKRAGSYAYTQLTRSGSDKHLGAYLVTIEPKTAHEGVEYHHEGEEFIYVLKGRLSISVGRNTSLLEPGESIHFNSALHHALSNPSSKKTELLVVLYIP